ncbi:aminotransferase class IV [Paraflavitalea sp. CAU 1676]|uniref:aminotransferase class IV n=1 Tax=Paraflavitalea sp. CAU 1676 TaxID=3032598 RepID=UPI0023DA9C69|nr:aminotransferase class IV [Paraflavitalea sp. CAU 1676]MDF2192957.1 aminotransferase class IV [Paraflavitalea sp. CAU 1676]
MYAIVNKELLPATEATLRVNDLAIQRGYGIFDFFKAINHQPLFLDDHLDRLYQSASILQLPVPYSREELKELFDRLMAKNQLADSGIRVTLTGGYAEDGYTIATPNLVITQQTLPVNTGLHNTGIRLVTYPHQRQLPAAKSIDYLMAVWLQSFVKAQQAQDVLYHQDNRVSECPRSNFFIVTKDDELVTPSHNILHGVIRKQVLQLARARYKVAEKAISLEDIYKAKEAFITSTTKNILPVVQVDDQLIGNGSPGAITSSLGAELLQLIALLTHK